jgi:hypothetical protein
MGYESSAAGKATQMLIGSTSDSGAHIWGGFDAMPSFQLNTMRIQSYKARLSEDAAGFVPGSGQGRSF